MAFGQLRSEKVGQLKELPKTKIAEEPVIPTGNISIVNLEQKKKPFNVNIRNYNPNEPKAIPNMKYSDMQRYRRYKTKTEPNLLSKIQLNEEDDIVNKIKEAFGIKPDTKDNKLIEIAPVPFYKGVEELPIEPEPARRERPERQGRQVLRNENQLLNEIYDIPPEVAEEITNQSPFVSRLGPDYSFVTGDTPENRISRREHNLHEDDFSILQEKQYPLTMAFATPKEKAILNRLSQELTPETKLSRTPEQKKKAQEEAEQYLNDVELTVRRLAQISRENITLRKVGRPEGTYGPVRRLNDASDRTPEENIQYFNRRKYINKQRGYPQKSLKDLMEKRKTDDYKKYSS